MTTNAVQRITVKVAEELQPIVPRFLENRAKDIHLIQGALNQADFETIRRLGHSMKGAGGGYGFDQISVLGKAIEEAANDQDRPRIGAALDTLTDFLARVTVEYIPD